MRVTMNMADKYYNGYSNACFKDIDMAFETLQEVVWFLEEEGYEIKKPKKKAKGR